MTTDSTALGDSQPDSLSEWLAVARMASVVVVRTLAVVAALILLSRIRSNVPLPLLVAFVGGSLACLHIGLGSGMRLWAVYIVGFVLFSQIRALADDAGAPVQYEYAITFDRLLFMGALPTNWLQDRFYTFQRLGPLEAYTMFTYLSYFFFPHITAIALWKLDRERFKRYVVAFLMALYIALIIHFIAPTAPPWMAGQEGRIPQVYQIVSDISGEVSPGAYEQAYEVAGANDVAAMPSLHAAIPFLMMFALWKFPVVRWLGLAYALSMLLAIVYLGEHYFVDGLAGLAVAFAAWPLAAAALAWWARRSGGPRDSGREPELASPLAPAGDTG